jgi:hypothetical protein
MVVLQMLQRCGIRSVNGKFFLYASALGLYKYYYLTDKQCRFLTSLSSSSHSIFSYQKGGLVCVNKLLGYFNETNLSPGDAIQICGMVAVELSGGPTFEDFHFEPGRIT